MSRHRNRADADDGDNDESHDVEGNESNEDDDNDDNDDDRDDDDQAVARAQPLPPSSRRPPVRYNQRSHTSSSTHSQRVASARQYAQAAGAPAMRGTSSVSTVARPRMHQGSIGRTAASDRSSASDATPSERRHQALHHQCPVTKAQLRAEHRETSTCRSCGNAYRYHRERDSDPLPDLQSLRGDYRSDQYSSSDPDGRLHQDKYFKSDRSHETTASERESHHDARSKAHIYGAYVPGATTTELTESDWDLGQHDSTDGDYRHTTKSRGRRVPLSAVTSSIAHTSVASNRVGAVQHLHVASAAYPNGAADTIIARHARDLTRQQQHEALYDDIASTYISYYEQYDDSALAQHVVQAAAEAEPYEFPNDLTTEEKERVATCPECFDAHCAATGTTVASDGLCHWCQLPCRLHARSVLCDATQENILLGADGLSLYENRCGICSREVREHNVAASQTTLFVLPAEFKKDWKDRLSLQPPWHYEFYPDPSTRRGSSRPVSYPQARDGPRDSDRSLDGEPGSDNAARRSAQSSSTMSAAALALSAELAKALRSNDNTSRRLDKIPDLKRFPIFGDKKDMVKDALQYLTQLEPLLTFYQVPTDKWNQVLMLTQDPENIARRDTIKDLIVDRNLTWEDKVDETKGAKSIFIQHYSTPGQTQKWYRDFTKLHQDRNEKASDFVDRFRNITGKLQLPIDSYGLILSAEQKFSPEMQRGFNSYKLNHYDHSQSIEYEFHSLEELFSVALALDNNRAAQQVDVYDRQHGTDGDVRDRRRRSNDGDRDHPRRDQRSNSGHRPRDSLAADRKRLRPPQSPARAGFKRGRGGQRGGHGGGPPGAPNSDIECYRCGYQGHRQRDCVASRHKDGAPLSPHRNIRAINIEQDAVHLSPRRNTPTAKYPIDANRRQKIDTSGRMIPMSRNGATMRDEQSWQSWRGRGRRR